MLGFISYWQGEHCRAMDMTQEGHCRISGRLEMTCLLINVLLHLAELCGEDASPKMLIENHDPHFYRLVFMTILPFE